MWKQCRNISNHDRAAATKNKYKQLKAHIQSEIRHAYWSYIEQVILPLEDKEKTSKSFWSFVRRNRTEKMGIASLKSPDTGEQVGDTVGKATILNKQFSRLSPLKRPCLMTIASPRHTQTSLLQIYSKWHTATPSWIGPQQSQWPRQGPT